MSADAQRRAGGEIALAAVAAVLALGLQIWAIHGQSLSGDGAHHFLAGHQALRYGQNTINFEHPPLVKLVAALPLLFEPEPLAPPLAVEDALATVNGVYAKSAALRRATVRGRYLALAVFIVPFLFACYVLGRRFGGPRAGVVLALMVALSLSVLPYLSILQTDTAVALAFLLTLLQAIRYLERPGPGGAALLGLAFGFGLAVKFSALLLAPTVLLGVLLAPLPWRRRFGHLAAVGLVAVAVLEVAYLAANRDYSSDLGRRQIRTYCANRGTLAVDDRMRGTEATLLAIERIEPRLAQWLTGFLGIRVQNAIGVYPSYAFGEIRSGGRWWYFPAVLLIKTPIAILLAALLALARPPGNRPWRRLFETPRGPWLLVGVTVAVYLATAVTSSYNLSVRHMLPVTPLVYLPVALAVARLRFAAPALIAVLAVESLAVAPLWMSQTNTWWLGSHNPTRFSLAAGNLEYRQNFIQLARYAERHRLGELGVLYPGLGEEVITAYLPAARQVSPGDPLPSGWYAVSVVVEQFVPALLAARPEDVYDYDDLHRAAEAWQPLWHAVRRGEDHGYVAGTFHLYRLTGDRVLFEPGLGSTAGLDLSVPPPAGLRDVFVAAEDGVASSSMKGRSVSLNQVSDEDPRGAYLIVTPPRVGWPKQVPPGTGRPAGDDDARSGQERLSPRRSRSSAAVMMDFVSKRSSATRQCLFKARSTAHRSAAAASSSRTARVGSARCDFCGVPKP